MASSPVLSVIIPVYNDSGGLRQTLSSLVKQREAPEYEVIVVDNDSTDETPDVIEEFEAKYPDIVFGCSETDIQSSYAARNTGIEHASGEIIGFIDADVTVDETWVADVYERFHESNVDYLGCNVEMYIPEGEDTFWARYDVAMGLPVEHYLGKKNFAPTCALAVRGEIFDSDILFDESLVSGGDKEFGKRVHEAGSKMDYAGTIVVRHPARTSFVSQFRKAVRIGKGQMELWRKHGLARHPLSFIRVLPPSPLRIKERNDGGLHWLSIYICSYVLKLIQTGSSIKQYILTLLKFSPAE